LNIATSTPLRTAAWLMATGAMGALIGCASGTKLDEGTLPGVESRQPVPNPAEGGTALASRTPEGAAAAAALAQQQALAQSRVAPVDSAAAASAVSPSAEAAAAAAMRQRVVYFDFDSFVIKDDYKPMIEAHARVMQLNAEKRLVIEGHTDERGGREYNLALGQKRAEAVLRSLALLGVPEARLEAVSFGQERPAAQGSGESAWAQNRRAELRDR
jgi:peptidoglycan-associated lipoprotein